MFISKLPSMSSPARARQGGVGGGSEGLDALSLRPSLIILGYDYLENNFLTAPKKGLIF